MIFQTNGAIEKIVAGEKTQTRRIVKPGEFTLDRYERDCKSIVWNIERDHRCVYVVGKDYAVQPGRGKRATWYYPGKLSSDILIDDRYVDGSRLSDDVLTIAGYKQLRIRIESIRREDVRTISEDDARAEGYQTQESFWEVWIGMHDKSYLKQFNYAADMNYLREYGFYDRPAARYEAWAITFSVVSANENGGGDA